jgi:hypothetical protein
MIEDRGRYRDAPDGAANLRVTVVGAGGRRHATEVVDICGGGVRLRLPPILGLAVPLGSTLMMRFESSLLTAPLETPGIVMRSEHTDAGTVTGVRFLDWIGLAASIPPALAPLFNLRADRRLDLDATQPTTIVVRTLDSGFEVAGVLRDISRGGLSLCAPPVAECLLAPVERIGLSFELPQIDDPFAMIGLIRHRDLTGESIHYCFDPDCRTNAAHQERIASYVEERFRIAVDSLTAC